jgi:hypothetical protein
MSNRVHTSVERMEPPGHDPMVDRALAEAHPEELPPRHDPMLPLGKHRDHLVECLQLTLYFREK